ncbi:hypothetical protein ACFL23_03245 [Patescibacteria group bacterium]
MISSYRKTIIVIFFILISLLLGFFIFYFFFYSPAVAPVITPIEPDLEIITGLPETTEGERVEYDIEVVETIEDISAEELHLSEIATGGITKTANLYESPLYESALAPNGQDIVSYDKITGKFIRITADGRVDLMSDKIFHNVEKVTWSPNKDIAILEYPDGANISYNFITKKQITLPKHWQDFSFSPANNKIVAKSISEYPEHNWLITSNIDGSDIKAIEHLGENGDNVYTSWSPNNQVIAMYAESKDFNSQKLFFFGPNDEKHPLTMIEGYNFESKWTKTGDKLLYNVYNSASNFKPTLWTVVTSGENFSRYRKKLDVQTWSNKCAFASNEYIYCAVPESLPDGSGIYPEVADQIPDNIYKINIATGAKKIIARPEDNAVISEIIISEDEKYLYYTDKNTGMLKKMLLK